MMATAELTNLVDTIAGKGEPRAAVERRLALAGLGLVRALRDSLLTIDEAERELFNLDTYRAARRRRFRRELVQFLEWGMELGDVEQLAKNGLNRSYREMERLLLQVLGGNGKRPGPRPRKSKKH